MQEPTDQNLARAALNDDWIDTFRQVKVESVCLSDLIAELREEVETPRKPKKKSSKIKFTLTPEERKKRNRKRRSKR